MENSSIIDNGVIDQSNALSTHDNYMLASNTNETSMECQYVDIGKPYNRHEAVSGHKKSKSKKTLSKVGTV